MSRARYSKPELVPEHPILSKLSEQDQNRLREHLNRLPAFARSDVWDILRKAMEATSGQSKEETSEEILVKRNPDYKKEKGKRPTVEERVEASEDTFYNR